MQALYGRNGESPVVVLAASTPTDCFEMAYKASKIALEHMTPVILLTDAFIANGSSAWRIPDLAQYPDIRPNYVRPEMLENNWKPYLRDENTKVRYWAVPGMEGFMHRLGGLEKDYNTSAISTDPVNHQKMVDARKAKIENVAADIPDLRVLGDPSADLLVVSCGGTFGHVVEAVNEMNAAGKKTAMAHFSYINHLPRNTEEVLKKYKKVVVCELNDGQLAGYLRMKIEGLSHLEKFNKVQGQPFKLEELTECFTKLLEE